MEKADRGYGAERGNHKGNYSSRGLWIAWIPHCAEGSPPPKAGIGLRHAMLYTSAADHKPIMTKNYKSSRTRVRERQLTTLRVEWHWERITESTLSKSPNRYRVKKKKTP